MINHFRPFWDYNSKGWARRYFERWYSWGIRCRLEPVKKVARMLKAHKEGLLYYFDHRISNAVAEGLISRIQTVKSNAREYRSFEGLQNEHTVLLREVGHAAIGLHRVLRRTLLGVKHIDLAAIGSIHRSSHHRRHRFQTPSG